MKITAFLIFVSLLFSGCISIGSDIEYYRCTKKLNGSIISETSVSKCEDCTAQKGFEVYCDYIEY